MELRLLRSFVAVAEELHFGRAARRLHISQPPLSNQIRRLEDDLGVRLFERTRRSVSMTEAGAALLGRARHLLSEAERARLEVARVAKGERGVLSIGYTPTATYEVLPLLVPRFRAQAPDVRLDLAEMRSALLPEALRAGRIEVGFACAPVDTRGVLEKVLVRERLMVALPSSHRLAKKVRLKLGDLAGEPFVLVRRDIEPGWADGAANALSRAGVELDVVQETDSKIALLGLVAAGLGLSIVSESMGSVHRRGVTLRPLAGISYRFTLSLLYTKNPSAPAAELIALAREAYRPQRPVKR
jgi:DNA-binding transcriptional LysR family regulator